MLYDKQVVIQILGSLVKNPSLFIEDRYNISQEDFADRFHTIIFGAVKNLFYGGTQVITPIEIDTYLSSYAMQKKIFDDNNGIQYVENLIKYAKVENFDFNYQQLKKYTLLRQLKVQGIDTQNFINEELVDPKKIDEMRAKFNELTVNDILNEVEKKIVTVKDRFYFTDDEREQHIGKGLKQLIDSFELSPEMGLPMNGDILNTICRGARRKKLYLDSRPSGMYKSRAKLADCAKISIPYYYNTETKQWQFTNCKEPSLFITTELEVEEVQTMLIAYLTGINESLILDGNLSPEQKKLVIEAIQYIDNSEMYIVHLPNYSVNDVVRTIKKYSVLHNVGYVFFDYIFTTPKMLQEMSQQAKGVALRPDMVLLNMITVLKDLCNELDIFLSTSTQVSDGWQLAKYPDSSLIRNCKGLADKADIAYVGLPTSKEDLSLLEPILNTGMYLTPNICYHIYKVRRGSYNKVRLYSYFDAGTCRTTECFVTNNNGELINIAKTSIEVLLDRTATTIENITAEANELKENNEGETDIDF